MTDSLPVLEVVAAVIEHEGMLLVCRRADGRSAAGKWEFPGGKIEEDETPAQALTREIREELGVSITISGHLTTDDTVVSDRTIRLTCLRAVLTDAIPVASTDHDALAWLAPSGLLGRCWAEPDLPAVSLLSNATTSGTPGQ
ncbi:(deoxy)nucleoside triphosphate pyrophosphohydrolase [Microbacterium sp. NPDC076911]|uniref:(deoxy)nucleoside triphosphate pyrophosphohydrolase n=1 Tax=Microbacterium sp. NPDC076911 TaxID=3154958 RepID=UPI0034286B53